MKIHRWLLAGIVAGISALAVSSCAYDPYYSGGSYSTVGGGFGDGYGYGGSSFSTSFFVSTGNPRWGYDPYAGAYYDYTRRCYYDPYLYGYYPRGYRPRYVHGAPHPHGWSRGRNRIAPPSRIRSHNLNNYHNRGERYRGLGRDWSRNVRVNAPGSNRGRNSAGSRGDRRPGYSDRDSNRGGAFGNNRVPNRGNNIGNNRVPNRGSGAQSGRVPNRGSGFDSGRVPNRGGSFGNSNRNPNVRPQPSGDRGRGSNPGATTRPGRNSGGFISGQNPRRSQPSLGGGRGDRGQAPTPQVRPQRQSRPEMQRGGGGSRGRGVRGNSGNRGNRDGGGGSRGNRGGGDSGGRSPRGLGQG